ncbi:MAG: thiamine phosphate synthase [Wenzhouxiangella sp.]
MNPSAPVITPGLYAVTPAGWPAERLLSAVDQALAGGLSLLQYREKPGPNADVAQALLARCRQAGVPLIINDDVELAAAIGADGVHLGRDDGDLQPARQRLGPTALIGVSCYNDLDRAEQLAQQGADLLAFGSLFDSPTKPAAVHCPLSVLGQARRFGRPVCGIGGVELAQAPQAIAAGADLLAVITDLFEANDITQRTRDYAALFANPHPFQGKPA